MRGCQGVDRPAASRRRPCRSCRSAGIRASPCRTAAGRRRSSRARPRRRGRRSLAVQPRLRMQVFSPETLAATFGWAAAARSSASHAGISSVPIGGLPRWSITIVSSGNERASMPTSPKWRGKTTGSSRMSPRSSSWARLSSTAGRTIQWASASSWIRWRTARSFGSSDELVETLPRVLAGEASGSHAVTAPIQSCSAAWAKSWSVSASAQPCWTRIVRPTPLASSSGASSSGSNVRAIGPNAAVSQACGDRSRFHR